MSSFRKLSPQLSRFGYGIITFGAKKLYGLYCCIEDCLTVDTKRLYGLYRCIEDCLTFNKDYMALKYIKTM